MADFFISENGEYFKVLADDNLVSESGEMLFAITLTPPAVIVDGNPIGLLLALTYQT